MTDSTDTPHETRSTNRSSGSDATVALTAIVAAARRIVRDRPSRRLFGPFLLAGLVGAASTVARLESPYAVGVAPFPRAGVVHVPLALVPALEPTIEIGSATVVGLKPAFLAILVGWQAALALVVATAFAVVVWRAAPETTGRVPPRSRIGWLAGYVAAVQAAFLGLPYASAVLGGSSGLALLLVLLAIPIAVGLFLTPAWIVLEGRGPLDAARESVRDAASRPGSIAGCLVGAGVLGYVLTGVSTFVPGSATVGVAIGTLASVAIAGPVHAVLVSAAYRVRPDRPADAASASRAD